MNTKTRLQMLLVVSGMLCFSLMFGAHGVAAEKTPCDEDVATFCKDITPGTPAMMDCLEANENKLSPACREYEVKMGGKRGEMKEEVRHEARIRQACSGDVAAFCKDVNPRQGGVATCLREHKNSLSAACRESIKAVDAEKAKTN